MWPWHRWPAVHHETGELWFWQLRGGQLSGAYRPAEGDPARPFTLGRASAFAVGGGAAGRPRVLLQRPRDPRCELQLVEMSGDAPIRRSVVAAGAGQFFPHFLPPSDAGAGWAPGWVRGGRIHIITEERALPASLHSMRALLPGGWGVGWPWAFSGRAPDGTRLAGFLDWNEWEAWEMGAEATPLIPGGSPDSLHFLAAVPAAHAGEGGYIVRRSWSARTSFWRGGGWSPPRTVATIPQVRGVWGGVSGCPGTGSTAFWIDARNRTCHFRSIAGGGGKRERVYLDGGGGRIPAIPLRVSGRRCSLARTRTCFSHALVLMGERALVTAGCGCATGDWRFTLQPAAGRRRAANPSAVRLHSALAAAIREVDRLRGERDGLRGSTRPSEE